MPKLVKAIFRLKFSPVFQTTGLKGESVLLRKNAMDANSISRKLLVETMQVHAKIEVMLDLQAEILSRLNATATEEEKLRVKETLSIKLHSLSQEILKLDFPS